MKAFVKENNFLIAIIVVTLIVAIGVMVGRAGVEKRDKTYDIILDYTELELMAEQSEHDVTWWLEQFKNIGIDKVALLEESIASLVESSDWPVTCDVMDVIMKDKGWKEELPEGLIAEMEANNFSRYDMLVACGDIESYQFVSQGVIARFQEDQYMVYEDADGSGYVLFFGKPQNALYSEQYKLNDSTATPYREMVDVEASKLMFLNIGFMPSKVETLKDAGVQILPRSGSFAEWNDEKFAQAVIDEYERYGLVPEYMIFAVSAVIGNDDGIELFQEYAEANDIVIGLIENTTQLQNILQDGLDSLVAAMDYKATRVFSVWNYIQYRYEYYGYEGAKEIENTLFRAVVERNIRVIYFKPFREYKDYHTYITEFDEYEEMFQNLDDRLAKHGFSVGHVDGAEKYTVPRWAKIIIGIGVFSSAVLLLGTILPISRRVKLILTVLGAVGVCGANYVMPNTSELLASFAAAVVFPCFALAYMLKQSKEYHDTLDQSEKLTRVIVRSALVLVVGVLICLIGGIMTAAPLSSTSYMLEIDIFRGVKAAQLLPIVFLPIVYLAYFGYGETKRIPGKLEFADLKDMMNSSIKVWMIIVGAAVLGLGAYYIMRTGHDSEILPSTFEMIFRNALEDHLIARPRNKEFLMGFPAVMLLVYTSVRRFKLWPALFGLACVVGLTCVVNTFMHLRTPIYLGLARVGYSIVFGIIIGIIGILVFEAAHRIYKRYVNS